jgi:EAL domain-containing protein (putative c-di-GMP-specific phosphodiesterase class I)
MDDERINNLDAFEFRLLTRAFFVNAAVTALYCAINLVQTVIAESVTPFRAIFLLAWLMLNATGLVSIKIHPNRNSLIRNAGIVLLVANIALFEASTVILTDDQTLSTLMSLFAPFYILIVSFYSSGPFVSIAFSLAQILAFASIHLVFRSDLFTDLSPLRTVDRMLIMQVVSITAVYLVGSIHRMLSENRQKRRSYISMMSHFDQETGLPNIRSLATTVNGMLYRLKTEENALVLAGIRITRLEGMSERLGYENAINWLLRFSGEFSAILDIWHLGIEGRPSNDPIQLFRLESSLLIFPIVLPRPLVEKEAKLGGIWASQMTEVLKSERVESLVGFYGAYTSAPFDGTTSAELLNNLLSLLHRLTPDQDSTIVPFNSASYEIYLRQERLREQMQSDSFMKEVYAVFQPKVTLDDGRCHEFEALARWKNPILGSISPVDFIPLAEQTSMMEPLTRKILADSRAFIERCRESGLTEIKIAFNLSPSLVSRENIEGLAAWVVQNGLEESIEVEITEGILLKTSKETEEIFTILKGIGVSFAIDDFGTGYSNLSYLQRFNAEVLKIDKSFIDGVPQSEKNAHLVKAILLMAKAFKIKVVAEGVESEEQMLFLKEAGCDMIQGYFYSKPLETDAALAWLLERERS